MWDYDYYDYNTIERERKRMRVSEREREKKHVNNFSNTLFFTLSNRLANSFISSSSFLFFFYLPPFLDLFSPSFFFSSSLYPPPFTFAFFLSLSACNNGLWLTRLIADIGWERKGKEKKKEANEWEEMHTYIHRYVRV